MVLNLNNNAKITPLKSLFDTFISIKKPFLQIYAFYCFYLILISANICNFVQLVSKFDMKKITVHHLDSVSEYFLNSKNHITEVKYLSNNRTKDYYYEESDPVYHSLISLFHNYDLTSEPTTKPRTINEYRQNKDICYSLN